MKTIIVATDMDGGIGKDGKMPWHIPEELAHFKFLTMGHTVIMGRKTYESMGRPLKGRTNVVVSRKAGYKPAGAEHFYNLDNALRRHENDAEVFIIGGGDIYKQTMPLVDRLIVTTVPGVYGCDTFFPDVDCRLWEWKSFINKDKFQVNIYERRKVLS